MGALKRLQEMGYTEEDLEQSNPYNQWMKEIDMKIKTSELTGPALDWAVKKALGDIGIVVVRDGKWLAREDGKHRYSERWDQGGPIIEREGVHLRRWEIPASTFRFAFEWRAEVPGTCYSGPTPLIAAMRCYVASKLGDEVDIPEELR